jgi:hypothetical protein
MPVGVGVSGLESDGGDQQITAHGFKGWRPRLKWVAGILMPSNVNLHTRNRTMFNAITCMQPNTRRNDAGFGPIISTN